MSSDAPVTLIGQAAVDAAPALVAALEDQDERPAARRRSSFTTQIE
jgi:hypothetical protein